MVPIEEYDVVPHLDSGEDIRAHLVDERVLVCQNHNLSLC